MVVHEEEALPVRARVLERAAAQGMVQALRGDARAERGLDEVERRLYVTAPVVVARTDDLRRKGLGHDVCRKVPGGAVDGCADEGVEHEAVDQHVHEVVGRGLARGGERGERLVNVEAHGAPVCGKCGVHVRRDEVEQGKRRGEKRVFSDDEAAREVDDAPGEVLALGAVVACGIGRDLRGGRGLGCGRGFGRGLGGGRGWGADALRRGDG